MTHVWKSRIATWLGASVLAGAVAVGTVACSE